MFVFFCFLLFCLFVFFVRLFVCLFVYLFVCLFVCLFVVIVNAAYIPVGTSQVKQITPQPCDRPVE